jgi:hypothetical protein
MLMMENSFLTNKKELFLILPLKREGLVYTSDFLLNVLSEKIMVIILTTSPSFI